MKKMRKTWFILAYLISLFLVSIVAYSWGNQCSDTNVQPLVEQLNKLRSQQDFTALNTIMDSIQLIVEGSDDLDRKKALIGNYIKKIDNESSKSVDYAVYAKLVRGYLNSETIALEKPRVEEEFNNAQKDLDKAETNKDKAQDKLDACCV